LKNHNILCLDTGYNTEHTVHSEEKTKMLIVNQPCMSDQTLAATLSEILAGESQPVQSSRAGGGAVDGLRPVFVSAFRRFGLVSGLFRGFVAKSPIKTRVVSAFRSQPPIFRSWPGLKP